MKRLMTILMLLVVLVPLVGCNRPPPAHPLPETPQELRFYPSPVPDYHIVYEQPEARWRILIPAGWAAYNDYGREGYYSTYIQDPDGDWELTVTREDVSWLADIYRQDTGRNYDSYAATASHMASAEEWDVDKPVREVIFLGGEDITIKGYAAYLAEYLWVPDERGWSTSWVMVLFLVMGTDKIEVALQSSPARMRASRVDMRDMLLSFEPLDVASPGVASATRGCTARDAVVASDVRGESEDNLLNGKIQSVTVTVRGNVTNTCNSSVNFKLIGVVYDKSGGILGTDGMSWQYYWERDKKDFVSRPSPVFHLAPGWAEHVLFYVTLSPDEFDRAASVAILAVPH